MSNSTPLAAEHGTQPLKRRSTRPCIESPDAAVIRILAEKLGTLHLLLAFSFALFVIVSDHFLPPDQSFPNMIVGSASSLLFTLGWVFRESQSKHPKFAERIAVTSIFIAALNCMTYLNSTTQPTATHSFFFLLIAASFILTSPKWMAGTIGGVVIGWLSVALPHWNLSAWLEPSLHLVAGSCIAISVQLSRSSFLHDREENRYRSEKNSLARTTTLTQIKQELRSKRRVEESLRESVMRNTAVLNAALDAIVTIDQTGRIIDFNGCAEKMFGARRDDVFGMPFADFFIPHELREAHRLGISRYTETRTSNVINKRVELEGMRATGERFPVELSVSPIDVKGEIAFTAYLRDLTEIRAAQETIESAAREQGIVARKIQEHLLSGRIPNCPGLEIAGYFYPCQDVGGDFLDFARTHTGLDVMVGDVMGKGVPAALVGASVKSSFTSRRAAFGPGSIPVSQLVELVDREYGGELYEIDCFVTMTYARFNLQERSLHFVNMGHTKTIRANPNESVDLLPGSNTPMGILLNEDMVEHTIPLRPKDVFIFYSDGLVEAENSEGVQFGTDRTGEILLEHIHDPVDTILGELEKAVRQFTGSESFDDDFTLAVIRVSHKQGF